MEKANTQNLKKDKKKIFIIVLIITLIVAIIVSLVLVVYKFINKTVVGNTIANIRNFGYAGEDDKYIYFRSMSEDGTLDTINRIDKSLEKEPEELIAGDWQITGINVYDNYIYFITLAENANSEEQVDNKIHKIKIDGSEHNVINNNEFNDGCYEIYVVKDKIYYIGEEAEICTMNLDGTEKTKMPNTSNGFVGVTDKYILYNIIEGQDEDKKIVTHMMNLDGTGDKILTGDRLYAPDIVEDYIYYTDSEGRIFKVKIGETESKMLSSIKSYCVNATADGIYSLKYINEDLTKQAIFKMDLNGENEEKIKTLETTSTFLAVLDEWIVYMDSSDTDGIIAMVSKDGKKYQELYSLNFMKYLQDLGIENILSEDTNQVNTTDNQVQ